MKKKWKYTFWGAAVGFILSTFWSTETLAEMLISDMIAIGGGAVGGYTTWLQKESSEEHKKKVDKYGKWLIYILLTIIAIMFLVTFIYVYFFA